MKKTLIHILSRRLWVMMAVALLVLGCRQQSSADRDPEQKIKIVTTTGMIQDALKNIVGDRAEVIALMGPGV
ncbi:MAG TPA: hypothetical protein VFO54_10165, partial [Chryseosolibacter sp.]|nr:hypothetical protein [Chryseosolibacter sp.]